MCRYFLAPLVRHQAVLGLLRGCVIIVADVWFSVGTIQLELLAVIKLFKMFKQQYSSTRI